MIGEFDDDDTHYCLKCHVTIIGLENYVAHRKAGCSKTAQTPTQLLTPDESFGLKADDFFSSLELQSSSKKTPAPSTSGKSFSGILTRSKTTAVIQNKDVVDPSQSKSGKNVWIGGQELKLGYGDNQTKLIKAVENIERRKEEPPKIDSFVESDEDESVDYDFEDDESSDEDHEFPPRHHTGGKWKPSSPVQWNRDWNSPPPHHTGGKWKPKRTNSPPPTHTKGKWKPDKYDVDDMPPPTFTGSKWVPSKKQDLTVTSPFTKGKWKSKCFEEDEREYPPPEHTKGKWKPDDLLCKEKAKPKEKKTNPGPSPSYTKGKWLPGHDPKKTGVKISENSMFRKSSGTVQYWCRPCNRRLASKVVYERHVKSELHFKRTLHDNEFDDAENLETVKEKRKKKRPTSETNKPTSLATKKKRKRKKIFEKCAVCKAKVNKYMIGKHMISHYHCRKGDLSSEESKNMILEHTLEIVLECPYQCGMCKFYCNTHEYFLQHWLSDFHMEKDQDLNGYYFCSFCKFKSTDSDLMYAHLISDEHGEVISVINRSVPIVIRKIKPVKCGACNRDFLFNMQLIKHCEKFKHTSNNIEMYKNNFICCGHAFASNIALFRHKRAVHKQKFFVCNICNIPFDTLEQAKKHRRTPSHRYAKSRGDKSYQRKCTDCDEVFENIIKLKEHINQQHPEQKIACPHCGKSFSVPQDLTTHLRLKSCKFEEDAKKTYTCDNCPYSSNSEAELLYHKVHHDEPLIVEHKDPSKRPVIQYRCPLCEILFPKSSLLGHIRKHTSERPFTCKICPMAFLRRSNLNSHMKVHEKHDELDKGPQGPMIKKESLKPLKAKDASSKDRPYLCSTCGANFTKRSILQQHMMIHTGKQCKCTFPGCIYTARKESEIKIHFLTHSDAKEFACSECEYRGKSRTTLNRHMRIHSGEKKFHCPQCPFSTRVSTHLKRHVRTHTGAKPFICPHCDFKCNSLDNLRKHVLSTNKHPGKCIYECKLCTDNHFQSNFAKEFKAHLVTVHPEMFGNGTQATSYVAGIYDVHDDSANVNDAAMVLDGPDGPDESDHREETILKLTDDPIVAQITTNNSITITNVRDMDEILPLYVIPRDEIVFVENHGDTWNLVSGVDEESATLVTFQTDETDALFGDHFN